MVTSPLQVLHAAERPVAGAAPLPRLLIAGATGALGSEVVRRLAGSGRFAHTQVLAREPLREGLRAVRTTLVPGDDPPAWPAAAADVAVVLFDPPRLFHDRERALWTPAPSHLPALAAWLHASGVRTVAVVLPHAPGRLPEALKRGLASLDEHTVAAQGFDRLLILRSARKPGAEPAGSLPVRLASGMPGVLRYMVPTRDQPVRAACVADLLAHALRLAPPGIHVATPEQVWQAAQGDAEGVARQWLQPAP